MCYALYNPVFERHYKLKNKLIYKGAQFGVVNWYRFRVISQATWSRRPLLAGIFALHSLHGNSGRDGSGHPGINAAIIEWRIY